MTNPQDQLHRLQSNFDDNILLAVKLLNETLISQRDTMRQHRRLILDLVSRVEQLERGE
jgi:hypothetical protein